MKAFDLLKKTGQLTSFCLFFWSAAQAQINRKEVVQRHVVKVVKMDSLASLTVGNGAFAFTVDATGLQTFPVAYAKGVALGTEAEWGWDTFKNTQQYKIEEAYKYYNQYGRKVPYVVQLNQPERAKGASNFFRQNVHRLQLGNVGLELLKADGSLARISDIKNIQQQLDPWTGEIKSQFTVEGEAVQVLTYGHHQRDEVGASITSTLLKKGRLKVFLSLPYPTGEWADVGVNYQDAAKHTSKIVQRSAQDACVFHQLDSASYFVQFTWNGAASIDEKKKHYFVLSPEKNQTNFSFTCQFTPSIPAQKESFETVQHSSVKGWESFWKSGAAIDFKGSSDPRAMELERRIILSEYLTKVQCAGSVPPQETGLTYNSWFGKPHLEMHWWHGVHFALWGRQELLTPSMDWYFKVKSKAAAIAKVQGFEGVRWQKMTDPNGNESPSSIGAMLIWQQPHMITFAELAYRDKSVKEVLSKYQELVFSTADFMASFAHYDSVKKHYMLGPGLIPAQERFKADSTFNPTYELAYWQWALQTAQKWRERLGLERNKKWDDVIAHISPLPLQNGVYLATESSPDSYTNPEYKTDHPSVLGTFGMLPATPLLNQATMRKTFDLVWDTWTWSDTWGWDFPMTAMTATRLGLPDKAIDALLMDIKTNTYLVNGHNYQDDRLRIYLPGNGGLLTAIALMCAGWDGSTTQNPGFPKNGKWKVQWEGFKKMP
ncbi:hypothetical protein [Pedobacter sp. MW01-1-1]|uniref:hypothetical protein n=1 Tax=Pedobacter sp. MW01-1-1 TaxID=3383027 RepID=UPI003FF07A46